MESIAVFIPVYNGEKYIRRTVESVLAQSYRNFKIYCVNDSSTDASLSILNDLKAKDGRIEIFTKENGGGTAKSWNFILPKIAEDFIFYMSQDDLISPDIFEKMIDKYRETSADCILPQMIFYHEGGKNNDGIFGDIDECIDGEEALRRSLFWEVHGFALRHRSLYEDEKFHEDAFDTDEYMTRNFFSKSKKVAFSGGYFYYRQDNPGAITKSFSLNNYFSLHTYSRVYQLLAHNPKLKQEKIKWLLFMIDRHRVFSEKFKNNEGIICEADRKNIAQLLRSTRTKLITKSLLVGKFWAKKKVLQKLFSV